MKNKFLSIVLVAALIGMNNWVSAQEATEKETLFSGENKIEWNNLGFFIAPSYGFTYLDQAPTSLLSLRGGISIKDQFTFGGYFNTSLNEVTSVSEILPNVYMDYWSVGGFAEYTLLSEKLMHVTLPLYFGYGEVQMDNEIGAAGLGEANFFQVEPSVMLEVNLHKFVRFNLGAGYRIVSEMNYRNFNQSDISGFTGYVGLKFGLFR